MPQIHTAGSNVPICTKVYFPMLNGIILKHGFAAVEIKVFELELEFELPQNVLRFTHFLHSIRHFVFFWSMTLELSIKLICISLTLAIQYIDVSVNRYTPSKTTFLC